MLEHYVPTQRQEQKLGHPKLKGDPPLGLGRQCEGQEAEEARPDCGQVMSCGAAKVAGPSTRASSPGVFKGRTRALSVWEKRSREGRQPHFCAAEFLCLSLSTIRLPDGLYF